MGRSRSTHPSPDATEPASPLASSGTSRFPLGPQATSLLLMALAVNSSASGATRRAWSTPKPVSTSNKKAPQYARTAPQPAKEDEFEWN